MPSLVFSEDSLIGEFKVDGTQIYVEFTVSDVGVENLDAYLVGVPFGTYVAGVEILNPFGGALLYGALFYVESFPRIKFRTDSVNIVSNDTIGFVKTNFAYLGPVPIFSNGIFGGDKLTYQFPSPYVQVFATNPVTVVPTAITVAPIIEVFPNPEPCFVGESEVLTKYGYAPVDSLKDGDEIIVVANGTNCVQKISKVIKFISSEDNLFCIPCGALAELSPKKDLIITGGHAVLYNGSLRHVECLFKHNKDLNITKVDSDSSEKTLYHIVLDNWFDNNIVLEEVEVESYFENSANNTQWIDWQCSSTDCSYNVKNVEKPI